MRKQRAYESFISTLDTLLLMAGDSAYLNDTDKLLLRLIVQHVKDTGQHKNFPISMRGYMSALGAKTHAKVQSSINRLISADILVKSGVSARPTLYTVGGKTYSRPAILYSFSDNVLSKSIDTLTRERRTRMSSSEIQQRIEVAIDTLPKPIKLTDIANHTGIKLDTIQKWVKSNNIPTTKQGKDKVIT